jgi:hypothetical protein
MKFKVLIPENCSEGQIIRVHCPDGTETNVQIPEGLRGGDSFIFEVPTDQLKNPDAIFDSTTSSKKSSRDDTQQTSAGTRRDHDNKKSRDHDPLPLATTDQTFIDREIVNCQGVLHDDVSIV